MKLSPMMQQYMEIKEEYSDCILFFRLGDFYEMFFDDAKTASKELELTLTGKNCGLAERAPMCGVPFHAVDSYISKLVERGYKVAVCEQTEDPAAVKGIVKREVLRIVTPGTITSGEMLNERENNYLASVYLAKDRFGFSYCDISTGEMNVTEFPEEEGKPALLNELVRIKASEIIVNEDFIDHIKKEELEGSCDARINILPGRYYSEDETADAIFRQFGTISPAGIGLDEKTSAALSLGALISYLLQTQKQTMEHIKSFGIYQIGSRMVLDKSTIKNLEITETLWEKKTRGSLLGVLDKTHTAMGRRKIRNWLREPLISCQEICERLDAVEALLEDEMLRNNIKESLKAIYDFERLSAKIATGSANGKDIVALRNSLYVLPEIKLDLKDSESLLLNEIYMNIDTLEEVHDRIAKAIKDDPPFTVKEGGLIKDGYSPELDELKNSIKDARKWIASLENKERKRTGISNLKVGYNKVFGYYIEITKSKYDMIPENYIRKQTLVNAERFITPELKETESTVLNAEMKINQTEYELFCSLRDFIKEHIGRIQKTSHAVSTLDVLASFAQVSSRLDYVKPEMNESDTIFIEKGRHPVIEQTIKDGIFVANDTYMDRQDASMLLITGPNMSGKSTYMRQTALIVLMAQAGCFVPCEAASIGITDRIFTRIGASDNLAGGQSTFFVEMSELAYILNTATSKSLVILDEIGRGTSTYDGLSIAWAAIEYLCKSEKRIRTLFASHYHELTSMEGSLRGFRNLNVDVAEENGEVIFLHKIVPGTASRSYGIHVARLAGVPEELLENAKIKLARLEKTKEEDKGPDKEEQISLFSLKEN